MRERTNWFSWLLEEAGAGRDYFVPVPRAPILADWQRAMSDDWGWDADDSGKFACV